MENLRSFVDEQCRIISDGIREEADHWKEIHAMLQQSVNTSVLIEYVRVLFNVNLENSLCQAIYVRMVVVMDYLEWLNKVQILVKSLKKMMKPNTTMNIMSQRF
jgi:hypothetical protein